MPTCMTKPVLSTRILDYGGAPLRTIQDFLDMGQEDMGQEDMGRGIDQAIPIIIPVSAFLQVGRFLTPAGQALVLRLRRMPRHECLEDRTR